jgi:hypothetical protein
MKRLRFCIAEKSRSGTFARGPENDRESPPTVPPRVDREFSTPMKIGALCRHKSRRYKAPMEGTLENEIELMRDVAALRCLQSP